jgi:hypothetical protein
MGVWAERLRAFFRDTASRTARFLIVAVLGVAVSVGTAGAGGFVTSVAAAGSDSATIFSNTHMKGAFSPQVYDDAEAEFALSGNDHAVDVRLSGSQGDSAEFWFSASDQTRLAPGPYEKAERTPRAGHPGLDLTIGAGGCNKITGRFDIKDAGFADGRPVRLWVTYEAHCEGATNAWFGEIRVAEPAEAGTLIRTPRSVDWPLLEQGAGGTQVPVVARNIGSSPVKMAAATIDGPDAGAFSVADDGCANRLVQPNTTCQVLVRPNGGRHGTRQAKLSITDAVGSARLAVDLASPVASGETSWTMRSDPGDFIGQGRTLRWTADNADLSIGGSPMLVGAFVQDGRDSFNAYFAPPRGSRLAPGRYDGAVRWPFNDDKPGIDVTGNGRGCNNSNGTFTVHDVAFDSEEHLERLWLTFEQHCEGDAPALRGEVKFRAASGTQPDQLLPGLVSLPILFPEASTRAGSAR